LFFIFSLLILYIFLVIHRFFVSFLSSSLFYTFLFTRRHIHIYINTNTNTHLFFQSLNESFSLSLSQTFSINYTTGPPSPPVPVLHSPPRKVTAEEQANWVIPPCISNWKNAKGYTIPLDKRLAADGRGIQDVCWTSFCVDYFYLLF
jgi:hypothetical protein